MAILAFVLIFIFLNRVFSLAPALPHCTKSSRNDAICRMFPFSTLGDSWAAGVAYSRETQYDPIGLPCLCLNHAYGVLMSKNTTWTRTKIDFEFPACSGAVFDDIPSQLDKTKPNNRLMTVQIGGNNLNFSDVARACIYQPYRLSYGPDYSEDPKREGECAKSIDKARAALPDFNLRIQKTLLLMLNHKNVLPQTSFDLFVVGYVHYFNDSPDLECNKWSFGLWPALPFRKKPLLSYPLRRDLNDVVQQLNNQYKIAIDQVNKSAGKKKDFNVHFVDISPQFDKRRFCEPNHSFEDQYNSTDVWIWNLSSTDVQADDNIDPNNAETPGLAMKHPPGVEEIVYADPSSPYFGLTARPFHPKEPGHDAIKNVVLDAIKAAKVPGTIWD